MRGEDHFIRDTALLYMAAFVLWLVARLAGFEGNALLLIAVVMGFIWTVGGAWLRRRHR
jgi:hypothetical protein